MGVGLLLRTLRRGSSSDEAYIHEYAIDNGTECPDEDGILDLTGSPTEDKRCV